MTKKREWTFNTVPDVPVESLPATREETTADVVKCLRDAKAREDAIAKEGGWEFVKSNPITQEQAEQEVINCHNKPPEGPPAVDPNAPYGSMPVRTELSMLGPTPAPDVKEIFKVDGGAVCDAVPAPKGSLAKSILNKFKRKG
jgi:hypothetical protein